MNKIFAKWKMCVYASFLILFSLYVNGAIPFVTSPTFGQAIWISGWSNDFAKFTSLNFTAYSFGTLSTTPIPFGLSGAFVASLFLKLGFQTSDSYSLMIASWILCSFYSTFRLVVRLNVARHIAILIATCWTSQPIIWVHQDYSMVAVGFMLLPLYTLSSIEVLEIGREKLHRAKLIRVWITYILISLLSIFTDGYSFVMFFVGSSILFICNLPLRKNFSNSAKIIMAHLSTFVFAILIYRNYFTFDWAKSPIENFRAMGLDLSYAVVPSKNTFMFWDLMHLGATRNWNQYFGDYSLWNSTFFLPLILVNILSIRQFRVFDRVTKSVYIIALLSFYFSLGPTVKIDAKKMNIDVDGVGVTNFDYLMPESIHGFPTGSSWISENLMGFNDFRASYRWTALTVFTLLLAITLLFSKGFIPSNRLVIGAVATIITTGIPSIQTQVSYFENRKSINYVDRELVSELKQEVNSSEFGLFLPIQNSYLMNYLASKSGFKSFNVGGDKNIELEKEVNTDLYRSYSENLSQISFEDLLHGFTHLDIDVFILPNFDWRLGRIKASYDAGYFSDVKNQNVRWLSDLNLKSMDILRIDQSDHFTTVRLKNSRASLDSLLVESDKILKTNLEFDDDWYYFKSGWYTPEKYGTWSDSSAQLFFPKSSKCRTFKCSIQLTFSVFGANTNNPIRVIFESNNASSNWVREVTVVSQEPTKIQLPVDSLINESEVKVTIPEARSPESYSNSSDVRTLGILLEEIEFRN